MFHGFYFVGVVLLLHRNETGIEKMINFTESQLKAALIELRKTDDMKAYQLCFDLLESKMNEDDFADWLDDNGFVFEVAYVRCMQRKF